MPTPEPIVYTHGDTAPPLELGLHRARRPVILDEADTVEARIVRPGLATITKAAVIVELGDADTAARVRVTWAPGELVNLGVEPVEYLVELRPTTAAGTETTPAPARITVRPAYA